MIRAPSKSSPVWSSSALRSKGGLLMALSASTYHFAGSAVPKRLLPFKYDRPSSEIISMRSPPPSMSLKMPPLYVT